MNRFGLVCIVVAAACLLSALVQWIDSLMLRRMGQIRHGDERINVAIGWVAFAACFMVLLVTLGIK